MIVIRESCIPPKTSHHHKRIVRFGKFSKLADKPELVAAKSFWDSLFLNHRPSKPLEGPLVLCIELTWPHPESKPKGAPKDWRELTVPMTVKPDLSNMAKTIEDSLGRCGFFVNDSQVCDLRLRKFKGPNPGILVRIGEWTCE